jgi:ribonuclease J
MAELIIHRGGHEIGGSAIEIRTSNVRVLFDLGSPLDFNAKTEADAASLKKTGVLANIQGLYADDVPAFDAIILSHAHIDHYGLINCAHSSIPIYLSSGSKVLMELSARYLGYTFPTNKQITFEMYHPFYIKDMKITPYLIDHSAFDAATFEIVADGKRIVYTGDFRRHGRKTGSFERFLKRVEPSPDILLCEGTTLERSDELAQTESELEKEIAERLKNTDGIALFQCSSQNIDRLVTFCRAAQRAGRTMVIDRYTAAILAELHKLGNNLPTAGNHPNLSVFSPKDARKILMLVRPSMLTELANNEIIRDGVFFYSLWSGYRDEERQKDFENFLIGRGFTIEIAHTSGHADIETLRLLISSLNPKQIIPIHTFSPERFTEFSDKVRIVQNGEVIVC